MFVSPPPDLHLLDIRPTGLWHHLLLLQQLGGQHGHWRQTN